MSKSKTPRIPFEPDYAVAPGATLQETIDYLGIDQRELAARTGMSAKTINQIIMGDAALTPDTALKLERVTGTPARVWNNLESQYREQLARIESCRELEKQKEWLKEIPVRELIQRGVIENSADKTVLVEKLCCFFGVASVHTWREGWSKPQFAFRKAPTAAGHNGALATWLRLAEIRARDIECPPYDARRFQAALKAIRELTVCAPNEFVPEMHRLCHEAGVALALEPEIARARISGATKWLRPTKVMIAVNLFGKSNDKFWFTFFHEAGHVLRDSKKEMYIDVEYVDDPREKAANDFAASTLIPAKHQGELLTLRNTTQIQSFAQRINLAPGIVVGRMQREGIVPWSRLNSLKVRLDWEIVKE